MNAPARIIPASGIQYPLLLLGEPGRQPDRPRRHPAKSTAGATAARTKETAQEENPLGHPKGDCDTILKNVTRDTIALSPPLSRHFPKKCRIFFGVPRRRCVFRGSSRGESGGSPPIPCRPVPLRTCRSVPLCIYIIPGFPLEGGGRRPTERSVLHD